jgi:hypothetical protein
MKPLDPKIPANLNAFAAEVLDGLRGHRESQRIILGGGVALQHYLDFRSTVDLDAWWGGEDRDDTRRLLHRVLSEVAAKHGLSLRTRSWGDTESYEILRGKQKVFCFQISRRDVQLDPPVDSAWPPVLLETFRDNLGAKMNALVERGAPRDFVDVFEVCKRGLAGDEECWRTWMAKNPRQSLKEAKAKVLERLSVIEARRPLDRMAVESERRASEELRSWMKRTFCRQP